eukprot:TRINITY_DN1934_c0_g3_i2.p1 TRINITY_DN1934_c0_g3~~TRINITY_DN1934_c0_g3_i2.p1  ORF type:complete len:139 (+),score=41.25 TRINITY_DN1934_c0_g3_i2:125-541(+)
MKVAILLIFALFAVATPRLIPKERRGDFCKLLMYRLTILHDSSKQSGEEFSQIATLFKNLECPTYVEKQKDGWQEGATKKCFRYNCMTCLDTEAYPRCAPGPKERCLEHSLCGDFGRGNNCIWIHAPAYFECLKQFNL